MGSTKISGMQKEFCSQIKLENIVLKSWDRPGRMQGYHNSISNNFDPLKHEFLLTSIQNLHSYPREITTHLHYSVNAVTGNNHHLLQELYNTMMIMGGVLNVTVGGKCINHCALKG
jgi:hypothetical protein